MPDTFEIRNALAEDANQIFELFDQSVVYQAKNGYPAWENYDKNAIIRDIKNNNYYKIVFNSVIAIAFGVCYTDKIIWREHDEGNSIYLHRIVVNPDFKGRKLFGLILDWAIKHSRERGLTSIRMDTWADNPTIRKYYEGFGFSFVEKFTTPDTDELPVHNRKLALTLLEYVVK